MAGRARRSAAAAPTGPCPPAPTELEVRARLGEIVSNLRWTWHDPSRALLARAASLTGTDGSEPVAMVAGLQLAQCAPLTADRRFVTELRRVHRDLESYLATTPAWPVGSDGVLACVAMEFALADSLPIFAGGLGAVTGEYLRAASDLGTPVVGVGLLYRETWSQRIGSGGVPRRMYRAVSPDQLPVHRARSPDGQPVTVSVPIAGRAVLARVWQADVGRCPLLLLDTDVMENTAEDRRITARLYHGDRTARLRQEIILGFGGVAALERAGFTLRAVHLHEGHAALAAVALVQRACERSGHSADEEVPTLSRTVAFTTHTPVAAGHDYFSAELLRTELAGVLGAGPPGLDEVLAWGEVGGDASAFCMTALGMRLAGRTLGVSAPHGAQTRSQWSRLWPSLADHEVPIGHVRNGIHPPAWVAPALRRAMRDGSLDGVPPENIWAVHERQRARLAATVNASATSVASPGFDASTLTIGIVGRFVGYKRPNLVLHRLERLEALLTDPHRPVQVVVAGEAHPDDDEGVALLAEMVAASRSSRVAGRLAFVEGFDLSLDRLFVEGVDVWVSTARPPLEACGVAGLKAAANGALVISTFDGWWRESSAGGVVPFGWTIGLPGTASTDDDDAEALYDVLETEAAPLFYDRRAGVPFEWVERMRAGIHHVLANYGAARMVREYAATVGLRLDAEHETEPGSRMVKNASATGSILRIAAATGVRHASRIDGAAGSGPSPGRSQEERCSDD